MPWWCCHVTLPPMHLFCIVATARMTTTPTTRRLGERWVGEPRCASSSTVYKYQFQIRSKKTTLGEYELRGATTSSRTPDITFIVVVVVVVVVAVNGGYDLCPICAANRPYQSCRNPRPACSGDAGISPKNCFKIQPDFKNGQTRLLRTGANAIVRCL